MGTRAIIIVMDDTRDAKELCRIYTQYDGYPTGLGVTLAKLCNVKITNGMAGDTKGTANGMGCLAAQIIAGLKTCVGNVYLFPPNVEAVDAGQEFIYTVTSKVGEIPRILCQTDTGNTVFSASAADAEEVISKL